MKKNAAKNAEKKNKLDLTARTLKELTVRSAVRAGCSCCTCGDTKSCTTTGCPD
jgi:hypothetical protein